MAIAIAAAVSEVLNLSTFLSIIDQVIMGNLQLQ